MSVPFPKEFPLIGAFYPRASLKTFFDPRYRPPTPVLVRSEKVKSEKWSEWVFGPLNLFNLRYIKEGVKGNNSALRASLV